MLRPGRAAVAATSAQDLSFDGAAASRLHPDFGINMQPLGARRRLSA